ncbi:MAG: carbohydrate kinase family protein, partial [Clostridia bacterium]|nr:carbohydrate kinase family protein [Clostridia bacterium]
VLSSPHTVTSTSIVLIQENGRRNFVYCVGNNDCFQYEDVPGALWKKAKVVSMGSLMGLKGFPGESAAKAFGLARAAGAITIADTAYDINGYGLSGIRPVLPYTDYFVPSLDEAESLLGEREPLAQAGAFLEMGAKRVLLKLGEKGCLVMDERGHRFLPAYQVPVVDTTGCGDNFTAGVILGILRGENLERCGMLGNAMGALNAMQKGASAKRRTVEEVLAFMGAAQRKET